MIIKCNLKINKQFETYSKLSDQNEFKCKKLELLKQISEQLFYQIKLLGGVTE